MPPIIDVSTALKEYGDRGIVLYNRVSTRSQAGPVSEGRPLLRAKTEDVRRAVAEIFDEDRIKAVVDGVEEGHVLDPRNPRKHLKRAVAETRKERILISSDVARYIRAMAFDHTDPTNREATPAAEEWAKLDEMTAGAIAVVSLEPPDLSEHDRHMKAIQRGKRSGRPGISVDDALMFLNLVQFMKVSPTEAARRVGISDKQGYRFWNQWKHHADPHDAYVFYLDQQERGYRGVG